jgi:hypothetical protein
MSDILILLIKIHIDPVVGSMFHVLVQGNPPGDQVAAAADWNQLAYLLTPNSDTTATQLGATLYSPVPVEIALAAGEATRKPSLLLVPRPVGVQGVRPGLFFETSWHMLAHVRACTAVSTLSMADRSTDWP